MDKLFFRLPLQSELFKVLEICDEVPPLHVNNISTTPPVQSNAHFDPYYMQESIPQIQEAMYDLSIHSVFAIVKQLLMDTGSPKNLTLESWLKQAGWTPVKTIKLPININPFRFAGQYVNALYAACFIAVITDINGKQHIFRQVAFILPDVPIPFLIGLQTQRSLSFNIYLRKGQGSHVRINKMNSIFPLYLQSHVWLQFQQCTQDPDLQFDWTPFIKEAFDFNPSSTHYACPVNPPRSIMDEPSLTHEFIGLADKDNRFNLVHRHSSRAPRRPHFTEQSELLALDVALRCIENLRMIVFQLLKKEVPLVLYVDSETLWINMIDDTVPCIPEFGYRCREPIHNGIIEATCLIRGANNPADAMTKGNPHKKLEVAIKTNECITPPKRVFMLQSSKWRHLDWIPYPKVPMPDDPQQLPNN